MYSAITLLGRGSALKIAPLPDKKGWESHATIVKSLD